MSKKFKSQASSSRAAAGTFGSFGGFSAAFSGQGKEPSSLTYVAEPPDFSRISQPQLIIAFKNSLKKDEVTRSKALDDLKHYISTVESRCATLDDGFLEAWVRIYPRASIDISRRVRQLAHSIQGHVASAVGKRIARFLPKIIGAWLAGLYDSDRPVHRSALESFTRVFSTDEKRLGVWKIYQSSILDFIDDVILQQTPQTLSDERTTKPDDAQAKHARAVGTAVLLFNRILEIFPREDAQEDLTVIRNLLRSKPLWTLCDHEDAFVRRSIYALLQSASLKVPEELDWKIISTAVIGKSLLASQTASVSELSETILHVTLLRPQLWTDDYSGKSPSSKRLRQYIQKGSQGNPTVFWPNISRLLQAVPEKILGNFDLQPRAENSINLLDTIALAEAFQIGLNSHDEPRQHQAIGWKSYVAAAIWLATRTPVDGRGRFIQVRISPLLAQYVKADPNQAQWSLPSHSAQSICADCFTALVKHDFEDDLQLLWTELSEKLIESVKLSLPEQSKEFVASQDAICAQAKRLFSLEAAALSQVSDTEFETRILTIFERAGLPLLESCLKVLRSRNGKPYGAAGIIEEIIRNVPQIAQGSQELVAFVQEDAPELLFSPSADRLVAIILLCRTWNGYAQSFEEIIERVTQLGPIQSNMHVLQQLMSSLDFKEVGDSSSIRSLVMQALDRACKGSLLHWQVVIAVLQNNTSDGELTDSILLSIIDSLSAEGEILFTMNGLSQIIKSIPSTAKSFQEGRYCSKLREKLLLLRESPEEDVVSLAESLIAALKATAVSEASVKSNIEILKHNLGYVSEKSLSIESLLVIAEELLHGVKVEQKGQMAEDILPSHQLWERALGPFLQLPPRQSTAITSPLGGIVHLTDRHTSETLWVQLESVTRDADNCSPAFRLAFFTIRILLSFDVTGDINVEALETLFYFIPLALQLIDDDLCIEGCNGITGAGSPEQREEYLEVVSDGRRLIKKWIDSDRQIVSEGTVSFRLITFWESRLDRLNGTSPSDYRVGEAFVKIVTNTRPSSKVSSQEGITRLCREAEKANVIRSAAWLTTLRPLVISSPAGTRLCNELIASSTDLKSQTERDGLRKLALLNLLITDNEDTAASIPTQRLVFLVKHLLQCFQIDALSLGLKAGILATLTLVFPCLHEIYGSHWEESMNALQITWRETRVRDEELPLLVSSFRLFACLRMIAKGDSNDDVQEAWSERETVLCSGLISIISKFDPSISFHLPRDVTVDIMCRLAGIIPVQGLEGANSLLPLLAAQSRAIQRAAYAVLHRYIPSTQEQISFDVALSKSAVKLPDELMSLLLEAPTVESTSLDPRHESTANIRSYLLSWKVVFDHFSGASVPVQEYYASDIRENDSLYPLLEFMFEFLQGTRGKMVDASKFDVTSFELDEMETAEAETQWLLIHLYYLCLKYLANMTKGWWIDTKKRVKGPVEAWTEKYISPRLVEDALRAVREWVTTQDPNEERALAVKISAKSAEVIASIPVDEESPPVTISVCLPPGYPLQPASVVGRSRVLVDERKWKGWLLTIQGVIMFANGSLIDGLLAFRRNVQGALKGQSECAICYSVISTDMQTPNKRCATCKNTFHSVCLYRWFKSSNQSTCPLCRNNFVYV